MIDFADEWEQPPPLALPPSRPTRRCDCGQIIVEGTLVHNIPITLGDPCPFCGLALEPSHAMARGNEMQLPQLRRGPIRGPSGSGHGLDQYRRGCRCAVCLRAHGEHLTRRADAKWEAKFTKLDGRSAEARALKKGSHDAA